METQKFKFDTFLAEKVNQFNVEGRAASLFR